MREFGKISTSIWQSDRFNKLPDFQTKLFYIYLHTNTNANSIGCYRLISGYVSADLDISNKDVDIYVNNCVDNNLITYDAAEKIVMIKNFMEHSPVRNKSHAIGACKSAFLLPDCPPKLDVLRVLKVSTHVRDDDIDVEIKRLETLMPTYMSTTMSHTKTKTETETQTKTETKTEKDKDSLSRSDDQDEKKGFVYPEEFEKVWAAYPRRIKTPVIQGKKPTYNKFKLDVKNGDCTWEEILDGTIIYAKSDNVKGGFIQLPITYANQQGWMQDSKPDPDKQEILINTKDLAAEDAKEWTEASKKLSGYIGVAAYNSWFSKVAYIEDDGMEIVLRAGTPMIRDHLQNNYTDKFLAATGSGLGLIL